MRKVRRWLGLVEVLRAAGAITSFTPTSCTGIIAEDIDDGESDPVGEADSLIRLFFFALPL